MKDNKQKEEPQKMASHNCSSCQYKANVEILKKKLATSKPELISWIEKNFGRVKE